MRARKVIKKLDDLWRKVLKKEGGPNVQLQDTFEKIDLKDEVLSKSPRAKKLVRAKETKLDRQFGGAKLLARKLRNLP